MNNLFNFSQPLDNDAKALFNDENQSFLAELVDTFQPQLESLLKKRQQRQAQFDQGQLPNFDPATQDIREGNWRIAGRFKKTPSGNYRAGGSKNGHQCPECQCRLLHGGL